MDQFTKLRQQIATLWMRLDRSQRTILTGLFILLVVIVLVSALWARTPDYAVAFGDVSEADAAQIVEQLREKDIPFRLGSNGSIMVPRAQVHEVRLDMAAQGLPKGGSIGMELFDSPGLGMTEFQEQVSFRRAMEGELARTITSLSSVSQARVHLVIPQRTLFRSEQVNPSASVLLNLAPGASLSQDQVRAIRFLVAAAVEGLAPEQVTIVDHAGNTLALGGDQSRQASMMEASAQQLQYQQAYERGLESRLQTMLEHLVGPGNVVVRAAVEMDWDQTETTSEIFSPGESDDEAAGVLRSAREQSERYSGSALPEGGVPGADANLPLEGGADVQEGEAHEGSYERSDVLYNYEVSRMAQHSISTPGRVKRLAISALVDGVEDEHALLNIERVLAAAVGMDPTRGDIIQVTGMPFDRSYADQELLAMEEARRTELYWTGAKVAAFIILIVIALIYLRSILNTLSPSRRWLVEEPSPRRLSRAGQRALAVGAENNLEMIDDETARKLLAELIASGQPADADRRDLVAVPHGAPVATTEISAESAGTVGEPQAEAADGASDPEAPLPEGDAGMREANERIANQVSALARVEPKQIAQVIRDWMTEKE